MNTDQAKKLSEDALNRLMNALDNGHSDTLKKYLATMSRFHKYSWTNCLLIAIQRPDAIHVAGFHAWLKLGRFVRKGERGIVILAPMVGRRKSGEELSEDAGTRVFGFRAAHVFDILQTEGEALPEFATVRGDPRQYTEKLIAFVREKGIVLEYSADIAPAKGMSSGGRITLLPSLDAAEMFSVLAHEFAHETLHHGDRRTKTTKTIRETEAEAVAFVVSQAIGLDVNSAAADYISLYDGNRTTLAESLAVIQQTASEILRAIHSPANVHEQCDAA